MLGLKESTTPPVKAFVTVGDLPRYIDQAQIPSAKKPFSTILQQSWTHTINLLLPEELYSTLWTKIEALSNVSYSRVNMSLLDLIEKDFLNTYVKSGSYQLLSQGRPGIDNLFWLKDGILHLELPKSLYERTGLEGKPIRDGGQKHVKTRFAIDLNFRLPAMVHGKPGFERVKWAFKNVLNHTVTWLLLDTNVGEASENAPKPDPDPLQKHHPIEKAASPSKVTFSSICTPRMSLSLCSAASPPSILEEETCDLQEWLDLAFMGSPRIQSKDSIDPYLCRYQVPGGEDAAMVRDLVKLQWRGALSPLWIRRLFAECLNATRNDENAWFALSAHAFPTAAVDGQSGYTILRFAADRAEGEMILDSGVAKSEIGETGHKAPPRHIVWQISSGYGGNV